MAAVAAVVEAVGRGRRWRWRRLCGRGRPFAFHGRRVPQRGPRQARGEPQRGRRRAAAPQHGRAQVQVLQRVRRRVRVRSARPGAGAGRPGAGTVAAGARPSAGQLNNFLDMPRAATGAVGAGGGARPGGGGAAADFLQGGGGAAASTTSGPNRRRCCCRGRPARPRRWRRRDRRGRPDRQACGQNLSDNRAGRVENRQELQGNRQQRRDEVRNQVAENHPRLDFWSDHPGWAAWRINPTLPLGNLGRIGRLGWIRCQPTTYATARASTTKATRSITATRRSRRPTSMPSRPTRSPPAPQTKPESSEWMPLGVFAITQDNQAAGVEPTLFMQLAISKEGVISGTLNNTATSQKQTLEGMADKKSQRVAWCVTGQKRPIMETGISNLTQDSSPALVHFADGQTQQCLWCGCRNRSSSRACHEVRVKRPTDGAGAIGGPPANPPVAAIARNALNAGTSAAIGGWLQKVGVLRAFPNRAGRSPTPKCRSRPPRKTLFRKALGPRLESRL